MSDYFDYFLNTPFLFYHYQRLINIFKSLFNKLICECRAFQQ